MDNIKAKSINAVIWTTIGRFSEQGIKFVVGLVVARLLFPSDYGLIGMLAIFLAIPEVLTNSGFGAALIQKKSADENDFSTVFYFNIFVGFVLYFILYLSAPLIANFFDEPRLVQLSRVLGLTFIINSFAIIQRTILTKKLDFKTQTKISVSSILPSGVIGILFAYYGYGVWAIVFQSLSRQFLATLFFWFYSRWRPKLVFSFQSLKSLFAFGSNLLVAGLLNTAFERVSSIVIGKFYNAESLGYFTRAKQFATLPANIISSVIGRIAFPIFSSIQNDNKLLLKGYRKIVKMAAFINFPVMLGLIVVSEPLISLVLTDKWLPVVPYLQLMCIGALLGPLQGFALNVILAKGDSRLFLKLDILKKTVAIVTIFITYRWGVIAIIYGNIVLSFLSYYVNFYFTGKKLNFSFGKQMYDLLPYLLIALITAVFMYISGYFLSDSNILKLLVQGTTGVVVYFLLSKIFKLEAYKETMNVLTVAVSKIKKKK